MMVARKHNMENSRDLNSELDETRTNSGIQKIAENEVAQRRSMKKIRFLTEMMSASFVKGYGLYETR